MRTIHITGGRIIDPSQDIDRIGDLWLGRGRVLPFGEGYEEAEVVIDARGLIVCPGLIDVARPPPRAGQRGGRDDRHRRRRPRWPAA